MSVWRSRETERSPAVISLVVSRCQKNIQVCEKTYPGCRGMERGDSMGEGGGGAEDQNKFPTASKGEAGRAAVAPGSTSRIAGGSGRAGFLFKFRFGASFTRISKTTNPVPRLDRKRCLPPWTNPKPSSLRGTILRGSARAPPEG